MITFTKAVPSDAPKIASLARQIWYEVYPSIISVEQIEYMLAWKYSIDILENTIQTAYNTFLLGIDEHNHLIGFAHYSPKENGQFDDWYLHKIYTLPKLHGQGYGKLFINKVIEEISIYNAKRLYLNVNRDNSATAFYEKVGFKIVEEGDFPIGNGYFMNDYVMCYDL
jgi:GNAT superfamily N-acetyltransferase